MFQFYTLYKRSGTLVENVLSLTAAGGFEILKEKGNITTIFILLHFGSIIFPLRSFPKWQYLCILTFCKSIAEGYSEPYQMHLAINYFLQKTYFDGTFSTDTISVLERQKFCCVKLNSLLYLISLSFQPLTNCWQISGWKINVSPRSQVF